jgi:hypothetical protein
VAAVPPTVAHKRAALKAARLRWRHMLALRSGSLFVGSEDIPEHWPKPVACRPTESLAVSGAGDTHGVEDDDRPPICPRCGVTMVSAALSADDNHEGDWVCLECEELDEDE